MVHSGTANYSHIHTPLTLAHNDIAGLQGGASGEYYHLNSAANTKLLSWQSTGIPNSDIQSASTWNSKIGGSGTTNYLSKFTASGTIGDSQIQDDGTTLAIGATPVSTAQFKVVSNTAKYAITADTYYTGANDAYAVYAIAGGVHSSTNISVRGEASNSTGANYGAYFVGTSAGSAASAGINVLSTTNGTGLSIGIIANATGTTTTKYAAQLQDGTEGTGKFLKSTDSLGRANWATLTSSDVSGVIAGSGTANYLSKFTASGTIGNSLIQDNGTTVAIGAAPSSLFMLGVTSSASVFYGVYGKSTQLNGFGGYFAGTNGVKGEANGNGATTTSRGGEFNAADSVTNIGISGAAGINLYSAVTNIGGQFVAGDATNNYAVQLIDGSEGIAGRFLKDVTGSGHANWATLTVANTGLTITTTGTSGAATLVGNTLNIPQYSGGTSGFNYGIAYAVGVQNILL